MKKLAAITAIIAASGASAWAGAFTAGNLVIYRVGTGVGSLVNTGNAVFLDEYTPAGTLVQSVAMPTTASGANKALYASGTATSEGMLTLSSDGQYLALSGYASTAATSLSGTAGTAVNRVVGIVNASGVADTSTALTDFSSGNNPRSAVTDGTNIWVAGGAGGVRATTLGATTSTQLSTTVTNIRTVSIQGGQLYASDQSGSAVRLGTVGTGTPTTSGQTISNLSGISPNTGSPYQFAFANLESTVSGFDTLYVADDAAGIQKYSLVSGTWTLNGTITAAAVRGLTLSVDANTGAVSLFGTTGGSAAAGGGSLYYFQDTTGYNGALAGVSVTTIASALANEAFRGIAYAPGSSVNLTFTAVPEPGTTALGVISLLGAILVFRRKFSRE